jgi:hypothetical protein
MVGEVPSGPQVPVPRVPCDRFRQESRYPVPTTGLSAHLYRERLIEMDAIPTRVRVIQDLLIEPHEILYLVREMTAQHKAGGEIDWYSSVGILMGKYGKDVDRVFCITERMSCLAPLMKDPRMRGWKFQDIDPDCVITSDAIFKATAICPLRANCEHCWFDVEEFFKIVLEQTDAGGRA